MERRRCHAVCAFRSRLRVMPLTSTLVYLVGASGSGKDSLLAYVRSRLGARQQVIFAHRYITRAASAGGENHIALSNAEFELRQQAGLLAMHWESHGYCYGVGIEINQWLAKGMTVVVNGSREYLPTETEMYPELRAVRIEVNPETLRSRLEARGRESPDEISARLARRAPPQPGDHSGDVIRNDGALNVAGEALVDLIRRHSGIPLCA